MSNVSLRRLLSRLTALALSTTAVSPAAAEPCRDTADQTGRDVERSETGGGDPDGSAGGAGGSAPRGIDEDDGDLDASLTIDHGPVAARDAAAELGRSLALALGELRPLTATHLAATWSLSDDPLRRLAVAHALAWTFPLVGDALVIDHLSRDADPEVRAASARAAWARRPGGDLGVLARLSVDPDPQVREVASSVRSS